MIFMYSWRVKKRNRKWRCNLADGPSRNGFLPRWLFYQSGWSTSSEDGDLSEDSLATNLENHPVIVSSQYNPSQSHSWKSRKQAEQFSEQIARQLRVILKDRNGFDIARLFLLLLLIPNKIHHVFIQVGFLFVNFCKHIANWNTYISIQGEWIYSQIRTCMYIVHMTYKFKKGRIIK